MPKRIRSKGSGSMDKSKAVSSEPLKSVSPISFGSLPKAQKFQVGRLVEKVVTNCVARSLGKNLLADVYLAGVYHGATLADKSSTDGPGE